MIRFATFALGVALLTATGFAALPEQSELTRVQISGDSRQSMFHTLSGKTFAPTGDDCEEVRVLEPPSGKQREANVARKTSTPKKGSIITVQPEGTVTNWSRNCKGTVSLNGEIGSRTITGGCQKIVEGDNGSVYLNNLVSGYPLVDTWIYGEKDALGNILIPGGQKVEEEERSGRKYTNYLVPIRIHTDEETGESGIEVGDFIRFSLKDGKYVQEEPEWILALCENDRSTGNVYKWLGYGDYEIELVPFDGELAVLPPDAECECWAALTDKAGYFVDVAKKGDKVYLKGVINGYEGVIEGDIKGDEVVFYGGQYIGVDTNSMTWTYLYGGVVDESEPRDPLSGNIVAKATGNLHFKYDADAKRMISKEAILLTGNRSDNLEEVMANGYLEKLTLEYQQRNPYSLPLNPTGLEYDNLFDETGVGALRFRIPIQDTDGNLLDPDNLYYRVYLDGEMFTFYGDEYVGMPEDGTTLIPVYFSNGKDICSSGEEKKVDFFVGEIDEYGVQTVYFQPVDSGDPVELTSEIVTLEVSALKELQVSEKITTEWYDLQGRRLSTPGKGINIRVERRADGSFRAIKKLKR